jgi:hypothetical protein
VRESPWPDAPQLFRYQASLTAVAVAEPCVVLIENDTAFSILIAESAREDPIADRLCLDRAYLLRVRGKGWTYRRFPAIGIRRSEEGPWVVEDSKTRRVFHEPSEVPYHVIFISNDDWTRLCSWREQDIAWPVFEFAQKLFGQLPGFHCAEKQLSTPDGYANACGRLADGRFLYPK